MNLIPFISQSGKKCGARPYRILALATMVVVFAFCAFPVADPPLLYAKENAKDHTQDDPQTGGYYYTVEIGDSWAIIAEKTGVSAGELQLANPQAIRANYWLRTGERLFIPTDEPQAAEPPADTGQTDGEATYHIVQPGEYWALIAEQYGVTTSALLNANPGSVRAGAVLYTGERLLIPGTGNADAATEESGSEAATEPAATEDAAEEAPTEPAAAEAAPEATATAEEAAPTDTPEPEPTATPTEEPTATPTEEPTAEPTATPEPAVESSPSAATVHVVGAGEYWSLIAGKYGVSTSALIAANPQAVRAGYVLYAGEELTIPGTGTGAPSEPTATATSAPSVQEEATATPESAEEAPSAEATPTAAEETNGDSNASADAAAVDAECPGDFADYPNQITNVLNSAGAAGADTLSTFLKGCNALSAFESNDWTGDDRADLVVVYANPNPQNNFKENDLLIYNATADGFELGYHARAAGEVNLLSLIDMNEDGQADIAWIDTTCGASTCFATVNIRSWDGAAWEDWTDGAITMAYPEVSLEDVNSEGSGLEIVLNGGLYGSVGAGPQRARVEVWGSVDGAPYTLLSKTYNASECLYHTVLDANTALQKGAEGLADALALYQQAATDQALKACWVRPDELAELRSFSLFRQALAAANMADAEGAAQAVADLSDQYPGSVYDQLTQAWYAEYQASGDLQKACAVATQFAEDNPEAWEMFADYGYTNPTFSAIEVCPDLSAPAASAEGATEQEDATAEDAADEAAESSDAASSTETSADAVAAAAAANMPTCPESLETYPDDLPAVLTTAAGDADAVAAWLVSCDALTNDRGAVALLDLNGDDINDMVLFPTIISDVGFGPDGAQGLVLIYHGQADGSYELAAQPDIFGKPRPIEISDVNADGNMDIAWTVEGCSTFCVTEVQLLSWDGEEYVVNIAPGATIAEGQAAFESLPDGDPGQGKALVLTGGISGTPDGGLNVAHEEVWESIDGGAYQRIRWTYDREADGSNCMGLRLVEADVALQAAATIGYDEAVEKYTATIDPSLEACSIFGATPEEEIIALQGLASFRLIQAQALSGDMDAATNTLAALTQGQPDGQYTVAAQQWLDAYNDSGDANAACAGIQSIFDEHPELWQITDQFGYNHPALAAEQICFIP
ncbi:MAG: LysM peptidoglycan-binding domain-containing protein [Caldilineaceae bacterium]